MLAPAGARNLRDFGAALAAAPRRRDYKTVPMILETADFWDAAALNAVLAYKGGPKQSWDNTDLTGPWLNGMRNAMNSQIWSFHQPDFLCVSATHGAWPTSRSTISRCGTSTSSRSSPAAISRPIP